MFKYYASYGKQTIIVTADSTYDARTQAAIALGIVKGKQVWIYIKKIYDQ